MTARGSDNEEQIDDPKEDYHFTPSSHIRNIKPKDLLVEVIGYVQSTEGVVARSTGNVLTFILNNNDKTTIKIVAWGRIGEKLDPKIKKYTVVHINGACAKQSDPKYNNTSLREVQLNIYSNTTVEFLGTFEPYLGPIPKISLSDPGNIIDTDCRVVGYLKTNFAVMHNSQNSENKYCFGAIAEDQIKLPIKVSKFPERFSSPYKVGDHIELCGQFQLENNYLFVIENFDKIIKIDDETVSKKELSLANQQLSLPSTSKQNDMTGNRKRKLGNDTAQSGCETKKKKESEDNADENEDD